MQKARRFLIRSTLMATSFFGATFNLVLASHLFGAWRSLPWEPASEWEGSGFSLDRDGARLICGLFSAYFAAASAISMFGLAGIIKRIPPFLRIYRNYLIGDFAFFTLVSCLASSATIDPSSRANICEHVSRQQDFLRDAVDLGLNAENCEQWFERGVMVFMAVLLFVIMIRLHFIFAVSRYYTQLVRSERSMHGAVPSTSSGLQFQRVYILPDQSRADKELGCLDVPLYAPVPLTQVSSHMADQLRANAEEVWVSRVQSPPQRVPSHSLDRQVTHSLVHQSPSCGPVRLTDEKL